MVSKHIDIDEIRPSGVDAPFSYGKSTPYESESASTIRAVSREVSDGGESSKSLLSGPDRGGPAHPSIGWMNLLYAQYKTSNDIKDRDLLLEEVVRYARRVLLRSGFAFLDNSVTDQYPHSEVTSLVTSRVWKCLGDFKGQSKFSTWVYRVVKNAIFDIARQRGRRRETRLLPWKNYGAPYAGTRGVSGHSGDGDFEISGGSKTPLASPPERSDPRLSVLYNLIKSLPEGDKSVIESYLMGDTPREIGAKLGRDAKFASNMLSRIKRNLKSLAKERKSNVLVLKEDKPVPLPASEADTHHPAARVSNEICAAPFLTRLHVAFIPEPPGGVDSHG